MKQRILIVDSDASQRESVASLVTRWGYEVETAIDGKQALDQAPGFQPSAVIADLQVPGLGGFDLLRAIRAELPITAVIVLTCHGTIENAVAAMREGAFDYLAKPADPKQLRVVLEKALNMAVDIQEPVAPRRGRVEGRGLGQLLGVSEPMQEVYRLVELAASTSAPVMISGETGTGKELVARTIHDFSVRGKQPFVAVNCSAVPETLLESELFGYEKGAFTGALTRRAGYFELANGGTIFLDEIAEMSNGLQAKYLRPLQDGKVRRLGGSGEVQVDVRVMAATNQNVVQAMRDGTFRDDLYYRINVLNIPCPSLRRRTEDIPGLVEAFVSDANEKYDRHVEEVDDAAMKRLREHSWPGNVRELRNVVERAVIASPNGTITAQCLFLIPGIRNRPEEQRGDVILPVGTTLEASERELIVKTLASLNGNKTRAAHVLGVSVKTLHNKLRRWRLT